MKVIAGSSHPDLAAEIAKALKVPLAKVERGNFANGERRVWIQDTVQGENVILVQSFSEPTDEHIIEFLLLADALERMGARHINVVIPWMGYSLQDKVFRDGEPIAAKVVANLVSNAYVKRAFLLDLHNSSTPGFFSIPTKHLSAMDMFVEYVKKHIKLDDAIVASPDFGGLKRSRVFAEKLGLDLANIDKQRNLKTGEVTIMGMNGKVAGKKVILCEDVINTGSTVVECAEFLKKQGATGVYFFATHGLFAQGGLAKIDASEVDQVIVSNSVPSQQKSSKVKYLDLAPLFASALHTWMDRG